MDSCAFDKLLLRNVPHILEKIFFSLDYESFKNCLETSESWSALLLSGHCYKIGQSVFQRQIWMDEKALILSSILGTESCARRLLSNKMLEVIRRHGHKLEAPLHSAVRRGKEVIIKLLLDSGADPNMPNRCGHTSLHVALFRRSLNVVKILLKSEADAHVASSFGSTPLSMASMATGFKQAEWEEIVQLMNKIG